MTNAVEFSVVLIALGTIVQAFIVYGNNKNPMHHSDINDQNVLIYELKSIGLMITNTFFTYEKNFFKIFSIPNLVNLVVAVIYFLLPRRRINFAIFNVPGEELGTETYEEAKERCGYVSNGFMIFNEIKGVWI